ncbi:calcium-binding protein [Pseudomonas serbica]|uniref:calcium-binding protein n=1 Tax=Pseudomonas serbica TaxID=2965074 RepID=UPI00237A9B23|nr:calcium-binding protein [Pseudomonas serbica]
MSEINLHKDKLSVAENELYTKGPEAFYTYLSDMGFQYATLALGVANENSLSASSIGYLKEAALGIHRTLTDDEIADIKFGMANGYLEALKKISADNHDGPITREINFDEAELFHRKLFESKSLPSDSWIAKATYDLLTIEQREEYWKDCLNSAGNTIEEVSFSANTYLYMLNQKNMNHDIQSVTWLDRMVSLPVTKVVAGVTIHGIGEWGGNEFIKLLAMTELPGVSGHVLDRSLGMKAYDPLVLDLDDDGIETIAVQGGVKFDFDGDGIKTGTGWIARDDGILVFDRNGNSLIDNGSELFGEDTIKQDGQKALNGLDALRDLDSNVDGVFDALDSDFSKVSVWQDINGNGISEAGELKSLTELGITSIGLTGKSHNVDSNGNSLATIGEFVKQDGSSGLVASNIQNSYDINFATNNFDSEFTEIIPENNDFDDIPQIAGSGKVRNLYEASILDAQLAEDVRNFLIKTTEGKGAPLMDEILARWALTSGSKNIATRFEEAGGKQTGFSLNFHDLDQGFGSSLADTFLSKLMIIEKFLGNDLLTFTIDNNGNTQHLKIVVNGNELHFYNDASTLTVVNAVELITTSVKHSVDQIYHQLLSDTYLSLTVNTLFNSYLQDMKIGVSGSDIYFNFDKIATTLSVEGEVNPLKVIRIAMDLAAYYGDKDGTLTALIAKFAGNVTDAELASIGPLPAGIIFTDRLPGMSLVAFEKNIIIGSSQDTVSGKTGDDLINTWNTDDLIFAGTGNDIIHSAGGLDTYVLAKNSGDDNLYLSIYDDIRNDKVIFSEMDISDVKNITKRGEMLEVEYGDNSKLTIHNFFDVNTLQGGFTFKNGEILTKLDILKHAVIRGTEGNDSVYGLNETFNLIDAGAGDDTIWAGSLGSKIIAGSGNDVVFGSMVDDHIFGGTGDDIINGSSGLDSFYFAKGDGHDTVLSNSNDNNFSDLIFLTDTKSSEPISLVKSNDSLIINLSESDSVTLKDFFYSDAYFKEGITFSDQVTWSRDQILTRTMINGSKGDDQIWGFNGGFNNIVANSGDDLIFVGNSGSKVYAGSGNDTIYDGVGNDILIGGEGDDFINLSYGEDVFYASKGDGHDTLLLGYHDDNPNDRIVFTDIASTDEITVELVNEQLIINYGEDDSIIIKGFFSSDIAFSGGIEFSDQTKWSRQDILAKVLIQGTPGDDYISGFNGGFNNIIAGDGSDTIYVGNGGSLVEAGAGNDTIYDGAGNDILIGGQGDDFINLSFGQDIFRASKGDGHDTIKTYPYDDNIFDKIVFNDVLKTDIQSLLNIDSSLVIKYGDGDQITVKDFFSSSTTLSGGLVFSDESAWSRQDVLEKSIIKGTSGDDYIWGYDQAKNNIYAGDGNDNIWAGSNGSKINGQGGDDVIYGGAGNDLIIGGTGNDAIHGNGGADSYSFQLGDGQDTIFFENFDIDHNDSVIFSGLIASQATFEKNDDDLIIKYGANDQVMIKNALSSEDFLHGGFKFDDVIMTKSDISASINTYTAPELTVLGQPPTHTDYM